MRIKNGTLRVWIEFVSFILFSVSPALYFQLVIVQKRGPGSVVCITTVYGLDGPGIESR